ncbi:uncharacterized protein LOC131208810 isoform X2 [Anopheles bellator]|uniref:uncharacterized protein LOC131208810 isoform X2 n=1 Tax=Anopheles bellator TaxID=139047 RepID=UPI002647D49A|nr:uncharacterized protein LOC131208810 isoform X2 [Anopheles bellator]
MNTISTITVVHERPTSIDASVSTVMSLEETQRTQRPYRYGMMLLCVGALVNWLGLAENYSEPVRYAGVACILGACLICTAMCCWLHTPNRPGSNDESDDPVHVINVNDEQRREKPPDYDTVAIAPPTYDDAIKLDPASLLRSSIASTTLSVAMNTTNRTISYPSSSHMQRSSFCTPNSESNHNDTTLVYPLAQCSVCVLDEKSCPVKPPPYHE